MDAGARQSVSEVPPWHSRTEEKKIKKQLDCCLDVVLIDGLLIIAGEQSVLSDKLGEFA